MRKTLKNTTVAAAAMAMCLTVMAPATAVGDSPIEVDMNGDGYADVIDAGVMKKGANADGVTCALRVTDGLTSKKSEIEFTVPLAMADEVANAVCPSVVGLAKFTADGERYPLVQWPDRFQPVTSAGSVMYTVAGDGSVQNYGLGDWNATPEMVLRPVDFTGDGADDIVVQEDASWSLWTNDGAGNFTKTDVEERGRVVWGDFDKSSDGLELVSTTDPNMTSSLEYRNVAKGKTKTLVTSDDGCAYVLKTTFLHPQAPVKDVNDDSHLDVVVTEACPGPDGETTSDFPLLGNGQGGFTVGDTIIDIPDMPDNSGDGSDGDNTPDNPGGETPGDDYPSSKPSEARNDTVHFLDGVFEKGDINVLGNDELNASVQVSLVTEPTVGTAEVLDNGRIRYDRTGKGTTPEEFTYSIKDSRGNTSTAKVRIRVRSNDQSNGSLPSQAHNDRVVMFENHFEKGDINVLGNDLVKSGAKVELVKSPTVGTAEVLDNGRIRYDRTGKGSAQDMMTYAVVDIDGVRSLANVVIEVRTS